MEKLLAFWRVVDDRMGISKALKPVMKHPVPKKSKWAYVFGSATLFAFILQIVTGVVLATTYVPSSNDAYRTLKYISDQAMFGHFVRGLHYFGASMMILFVGIHMLRVLLYGAYKYPREANWMTGVLLLVFTLIMGFTGQLLRWDQDAVWSINIAARQAARVPFVGRWLETFIYAGDRLSGSTLTRFYDLHVFIMPALLIGFIGIHLYMVIHNGISEPPVAGKPVNPKTYRKEYEELLKKDGVPFWPDAGWRDAVFGSLAISVVVALAAIYGAPPLQKPPDPTLLKAYPRPDWYLLWYFAILALSPHKLESEIMVIAPALMFGIMFFLPVLFNFNRGERHPKKRPWVIGWVVLVLIGVLSFWHAGKIEAWSPRFESKGLSTAAYNVSDEHVHRGAILFHDKGCEYCHEIHGQGGIRGPNLTDVADRLDVGQIEIRILNGGYNMPSYARILHPDEVNDLVSFLETMRVNQGPTLNAPVTPQPPIGVQK